MCASAARHPEHGPHEHVLPQVMEILAQDLPNLLSFINVLDRERSMESSPDAEGNILHWETHMVGPTPHLVGSPQP